MGVPELEVRNHTRGEITWSIDKGVIQMDVRKCKPPLIITVSHRVH